MSQFATIGVLGAGAWGTALANAAARTGRRVILWETEREQADLLAQTRTNDRFLPGVALEDAVRPTAELADIAEADAVLMVVPAQVMREVAGRAKDHLSAEAPVVSCSKGIERGSLCFMSQILGEVLPGHSVAALSGPSFAADVARGLPTAVTLAASDEWLAADLAAALASQTFRLYHSDDVLGVEIGGAAKNVLAIGAGIAAGRGLGASACAALIARGFAELRRLGAELGAVPETLMGLSGLGDLVLTATSPQSRNYAYGHAIGAGEAPATKLAEGVFTAQALVALGERSDVELPIATAVRDVLDRRLSIGEAVEALLARPLKAEIL